MREAISNPAANKSRMYVALALLVGLGVLSWFTIDASAVVHVPAYSSRVFSTGARDVPIRWMPVLVLGLFAFRVVMAYLRARLDERTRNEG